ncbi:MAG: hypothetical protein IPI49_01815 [Myxococcales bacterium]|nr:hypothetical protein [Myxococcales bacterium]
MSPPLSCRAARAATVLAMAAALWTGCGAGQPKPAGPAGPGDPAGQPSAGPAAAPAPILADEASAPGTAEQECARVVAELGRYGTCGLLDEDRRWYLARWRELVETDLALAKSPSVDDAAKGQLAVSCRKAWLALADAATRCADQAAASAR